MEAPRASIVLVFIDVSGGSRVPAEGNVRWLFWWELVPQEHVFASQRFFVEPEKDQGTRVIPLGVIKAPSRGLGVGRPGPFCYPGSRAHRTHYGPPCSSPPLLVCNWHPWIKNTAQLGWPPLVPLWIMIYWVGCSLDDNAFLAPLDHDMLGGM